MTKAVSSYAGDYYSQFKRGKTPYKGIFNNTGSSRKLFVRQTSFNIRGSNLGGGGGGGGVYYINH